MARRPDTTPKTCDKTRLNWLRAQLRAVNADRESASHCLSHSAVASLRREERCLRDLIDSGRIEIAARAAVGSNREATPEERVGAMVERVGNAADDELEVAVAEWFRRMRYDLSVDVEGRIHVTPQGEVPELRLIQS